MVYLSTTAFPSGAIATDLNFEDSSWCDPLFPSLHHDEEASSFSPCERSAPANLEQLLSGLPSRSGDDTAPTPESVASGNLDRIDHDPIESTAHALQVLVDKLSQFTGLGGLEVDAVSRRITAIIQKDSSTDLADKVIEELMTRQEFLDSPDGVSCGAFALAYVIQDCCPTQPAIAARALEALRTLLLNSETYYVLDVVSDALAWVAASCPTDELALRAVKILAEVSTLDHLHSLYATSALARVALREVPLQHPLIEKEDKARHARESTILERRCKNVEPYDVKLAKVPTFIVREAWVHWTVILHHADPVIVSHAVFPLRRFDGDSSIFSSHFLSMVFDLLRGLLSPQKSVTVQRTTIDVIKCLLLSENLELANLAYRLWCDVLRESHFSDEVKLRALDESYHFTMDATRSGRLLHTAELMQDDSPRVAEAAILAFYQILCSADFNNPYVSKEFVDSVNEAMHCLVNSALSHASPQVYLCANWVMEAAFRIFKPPQEEEAVLRNAASGCDLRARALRAMLRHDTDTLTRLYFPHMGVKAIEIVDSGNTYSNRLRLLLSFLKLPPQVKVPSAKHESIPPRQWKRSSDKILDADRGEIIGRCRVTQTGEGLRVVKFPRDGKNQVGTPRELWAQQKLATIPQLESLIPTPLLGSDGNFARHPSAIAFHTGENYFRYVNAPGVTRDEFQRGIGRSLHDIGILARHGFYHTDLTPLRHNREGGAKFRTQGDAGIYRIIPDLVQNPLGGRHGMGRLDDVFGSLAYPNISIDGLRDLEHVFHISEILKPRHSDDPVPEWSRLRKNPHAHILLDAVLTGNAYFSVALLVGERMVAEKTPEADAMSAWRDEAWLRVWGDILLATMTRGYATRWNVTEKRARQILRKRVDWLRLSRQLYFFMSGAYIPFVAPTARSEDFPVRKIYGEDVTVHGFGPYRKNSYHPQAGYIGPEGDIRRRSIGPLNGPFPITEMETLIFAMMLPPFIK